MVLMQVLGASFFPVPRAKPPLRDGPSPRECQEAREGSRGKSGVFGGRTLPPCQQFRLIRQLPSHVPAWGLEVTLGVIPGRCLGLVLIPTAGGQEEVLRLWSRWLEPRQHAYWKDMGSLQPSSQYMDHFPVACGQATHPVLKETSSGL